MSIDQSSDGDEERQRGRVGEEQAVFGGEAAFGSRSRKVGEGLGVAEGGVERGPE